MNFDFAGGIGFSGSSKSNTRFRLGLFVIFFLSTCTLLQAGPDRAGAHSASMGFDGRIPGQPDFKRAGKTTYKFLPKRKEYEIDRPGKPPVLVHADPGSGLVAAQGGWVKLPTQESQPLCRTSGARVVVVYTHRPGGEITVPVATLRSIVRRMNWKIESQASQTNPARKIRMAVGCDSSGQIEVHSVSTATNSQLELFTAIPESLFGEPSGGDALKYLMFDQDAGSGYAGLGGGKEDPSKGRTNKNANTSDGSLIVDGYWDTHVTLHELFHSLGATQGYSEIPPPFASKGAHCIDGIDVLCYNDEAPEDNGYTETRCPASAGYETPVNVPIDCGDDTYFNGAPPAGSWLASHWDLAGVENPYLVTQPVKPPKASTLAPTSVKAGTTVLEGSVTPEADYAFYRFDYGTTTAYGQSGPTPKGGVLGMGSTPAGVKWKAEGLAPSTTYHYRVVASNDAGETAVSGNQTFTTAAGPGVLAGNATDISGGTAILHGSVHPGGAETSYQFEWGTTTAYGKSAPAVAKAIGSGTSYLAVSESISGLKGVTKYHFRIKATNKDGTEYSPDRVFTTPDWLPQVSTESAVIYPEISNKATFRGRVNPNSLATTYQFIYSKTSGKEAGVEKVVPATPKAIGSGKEDVLVSETLSLEPGGSYVYTLKGTNSEGSVTAKGFRTVFLPDPTLVVKTKPATEVLAARATVHGEVYPKGRLTNYVFLYGTTTEYGSETTPVILGEGKAFVEADEIIKGLSPGTTYHFQIVGVNDDGLVFGEDQTFTTASDLHRPRLNAASYPSTVNGSQEASNKLKLSFGGQNAECGTMTTTSGSLGGATRELPLLATFGGGCTAFGFGSATVSMNDCRFVLHVRNDGPPYAGSLEVACAKAGEGVTVGAGTCEIKIGPQEGIEGVGLSNLGEGTGAEISLSANSAALTYSVTKDGIGCALPGLGSYTNGSATGALKLKGAQGGTQVGVSLSGEEVALNGFYLAGEKSAEEGKQPRFNAESYPATVNGSQEASNKLKFGFGALTAECGTMTTTSGSLGGATADLPLFATFGGGCTAFGFSSATVGMNSCRFVSRALNEGPPYAGSLAIACTNPGDGIVISASTCEVKLPAQEGIGGIGLATLGKADEREVRMSPASSGIAYSVVKDGIGCQLPGLGSYANGSLTGALRLSI